MEFAPKYVQREGDKSLEWCWGLAPKPQNFPKLSVDPGGTCRRPGHPQQKPVCWGPLWVNLPPQRSSPHRRRGEPELQPSGLSREIGHWWPQGKEVFLFSPSSLFFLLSPLDPEDSCRGKQFSTPLSVEERWRAMYDTSTSCTDPSEKISPYMSIPVGEFVHGTAGHLVPLLQPG